MFFKSKKVLGLDIGSSTIKVAEIDVGRKVCTLQNFSLVPTPPSATSGGDVIDIELISTAVKQAIMEIGTKTKDICTGLWGSSVIVKRISIPKMDQSLIAEQIRWEAEQYIPYDVNEVNLDFKVLSIPSEQPDTMEVLLVAAIQNSIINTAEIVNLTGFKCSILDVEGFALANCFETNYGVSRDKVIGLLNVGSAVTNFVIVEKGEVVFARDIPLGGLLYTNEIAKSLGVSMVEAEGMKLSFSTGHAAPEEVGPIIENTHSAILDELSSNLEFFHNTSSVQVQQIFTTGGGSGAAGFNQALSQLIPAETFNPFNSIAVNPRNFSEQYIKQIRNFSAIAMGLGLRTLGDS
jgi:type IV pilus assembly protein PilM